MLAAHKIYPQLYLLPHSGCIGYPPFNKLTYNPYHYFTMGGLQGAQTLISGPCYHMR